MKLNLVTFKGPRLTLRIEELNKQILQTLRKNIYFKAIYKLPFSSFAESFSPFFVFF